MAVERALTNIVWRRSVDWKILSVRPTGCGRPTSRRRAALYDAVGAMRDLNDPDGIAVDGGERQSSMGHSLGDDVVKSPRNWVISAYATMPDITKVVTPDIQNPAQPAHLHHRQGKSPAWRFGSGQAYGQLGDDLLT